MKFSFSILALAALAAQRCFSAPGAMAANERSDPGFAGAHVGEVYAANEADLREAIRLGNVYEAANDGNLNASALGLSQALTQYATGVRDRENLAELLDRIAPACPTGSIRFSYLNETEAEQFHKRTLANITRPVHGEFAETRITGAQTDGACDNIGLVSYIDIDQGGMVPEMQQAEVQRLRNIILRSQIADALAKIDAAGTADTSKNWGDSAANPDGDVREMIDTAGDASGVDANVVVLGQGAFLKRIKAYEAAARTNGGSKAELTPDQLRDFWQVDDVINLRARYRSSATATTKLLDSTVYAYDARPGLSRGDSSNVKRFTYISAGGGMRVWIEVQSHRVKIIVDAYARTVITRSTGIRKRAVTFS